MAKKQSFSFETRLMEYKDMLVSAVVEIPKDVLMKLPAGRVRVEGKLNAVPFNLAVQSKKNGPKYLSVSLAMRKAARIKPGDKVTVSFVLVDAVKLDLPEEMEAVLAQDDEGAKKWNRMTVGLQRSLGHTPSHRKWYHFFANKYFLSAILLFVLTIIMLNWEEPTSTTEDQLVKNTVLSFTKSNDKSTQVHKQPKIEGIQNNKSTGFSTLNDQNEVDQDEKYSFNNDTISAQFVTRKRSKSKDLVLFKIPKVQKLNLNWIVKNRVKVLVRLF